MAYPWIKDKSDGSDRFLEVTSPSGIYSHKIQYNNNSIFWDILIEVFVKIFNGMDINSCMEEFENIIKYSNSQLSEIYKNSR